MKDRKNRQGTNTRELAQFGMLFFPFTAGVVLGVVGLYNILLTDNILVGWGELASGALVMGATIYFNERSSRRARERANSTPTRRR